MAKHTRKATAAATASSKGKLHVIDTNINTSSTIESPDMDLTVSTMIDVSEISSEDLKRLRGHGS